MKRILICGANGLLGQHLARALHRNTDNEVLCTSHHRSFALDFPLFDYTQLDATRKGDVKSLVSSFQPTVILNAAAVTNVDWCETHREEAWLGNVTIAENLVEVCRKVGAKLVHVSTDYVFDGKTGGYDETAKPNPINYYGKTKLAGENAIQGSGIPFIIARTIVVYGAGKDVRSNFALWVYNSLRDNKPIRCVTDQLANPTYVGDLAWGLIRAVELERSGLYHLGGRETLSRYEFALNIANVFGLDASLITPVKSVELNQSAPRPMNSELVTLKAQSELGYHPVDSTAGPELMKRDLQYLARH